MRYLQLLPLLCALSSAFPLADNTSKADSVLAKPAHDWSSRMGSKVDDFRSLFSARNAQKSASSPTSSLRPPNEKLLNEKLDGFEEKHGRGVVKRQAAAARPKKVDPEGFFAFSEGVLGRKYSPEELTMARCVVERNLAEVAARNAARAEEGEAGGREYDGEFMRLAGLTVEDVMTREEALAEEAGRLGFKAEDMHIKRQVDGGVDDVRICAISDGMTDVLFDADKLEVLALVVEDVRTFTLFLQMYPDVVDPGNVPSPVIPPFFVNGTTTTVNGAAALDKRYQVKHEVIPGVQARPVVKPLQDSDVVVTHHRI